MCVDHKYNIFFLWLQRDVDVVVHMHMNTVNNVNMNTVNMNMNMNMNTTNNVELQQSGGVTVVGDEAKINYHQPSQS